MEILVTMLVLRKQPMISRCLLVCLHSKEKCKNLEGLLKVSGMYTQSFMYHNERFIQKKKSKRLSLTSHNHALSWLIYTLNMVIHDLKNKVIGVGTQSCVYCFFTKLTMQELLFLTVSCIQAHEVFSRQAIKEGIGGRAHHSWRAPSPLHKEVFSINHCVIS